MAAANADVSDGALPTNLLYPSIRLFIHGEMTIEFNTKSVCTE
jgi:hypothetical protein